MKVALAVALLAAMNSYSEYYLKQRQRYAFEFENALKNNKTNATNIARTCFKSSIECEQQIGGSSTSTPRKDNLVLNSEHGKVIFEAIHKFDEYYTTQMQKFGRYFKIALKVAPSQAHDVARACFKSIQECKEIMLSTTIKLNSKKLTTEIQKTCKESKSFELSLDHIESTLDQSSVELNLYEFANLFSSDVIVTVKLAKETSIQGGVLNLNYECVSDTEQKSK